MTNLDRIFKSKDITLSTKICLVKAMVFFPVVIYRCESWTIKSTEELMLSNCGAEEDLRVPWTARRSNQSILKEISPEYSLDGLMLKPKLQYFGHLMWRAIYLIGKDPNAMKDWGQEEKGATEDEMVTYHHNSMEMSLRPLGDMKDREAWHAAVYGVTSSWTWFSNWITTKDK